MAPRTCEVCGELVSERPGKFEFICKKCELFIPATPDADFVFNRFIENFIPDEIAITKPFGLFYIKTDSDYLNIVRGMKYSGFTRIGTEFGKELGKKINYEKDCAYDGIVPVPVHHARLRERGFNQSEIIAKAVGKEISVPVTKAIKRIRYTSTQTLLSKQERKTNILDSIVPVKKQMKIEGSYLLIDDVLTTGSTINVCASVLLDMGASRVDCAVLAIA